jgi:hypothetical protein
VAWPRFVDESVPSSNAIDLARAFVEKNEAVTILFGMRVDSSIRARHQRGTEGGRPMRSLSEFWRQMEPLRKQYRKQILTNAARSQLSVICATPAGKHTS